jgi:hypothetical protein
MEDLVRMAVGSNWLANSIFSEFLGLAAAFLAKGSRPTA